MNTMKKTGICLIVAAIGMTLHTGTIAQGMSREEYMAQKEAIHSGYESARSACEAQSGNDKNVCMAETMGKAKIAKAELELRNKPGFRTLYKARIARSGATYSVAWQKCNDLAGTMRNVCIQEARSAETSALANALAEMKISRANASAAEKSAKAHRKTGANTYRERLGAAREATVARVEASIEAADARKKAETIKREAAYAVEKEKCESFAGDVKDRCLADARKRIGQS